MIFCWNLAGNYYARISSTDVLTFDVIENSKKEAWEPQSVSLWPETHLEPSNLATLTLELIGRDWMMEKTKPERHVLLMSV